MKNANKARREWIQLIWVMVLIAPLLLGACATRGGGGTDTSGTGTTTSQGAADQGMGTADDHDMGGTGTMGTEGGTDPGMSSSAEAARVDCSTVRCAACPEGQTPRLKPPNCCRCVPVDNSIRDCSAVRCAACPEGQHPALTPPDCCRCVAG